MIWIENVRPVKEPIRHIRIHVRSPKRTQEIMDILSTYEPGLCRDYRGNLILDYDDRFIICHMKVTESELNEWIKKLGLIEIGRRYNDRRYVLEEETVQV